MSRERPRRSRGATEDRHGSTRNPRRYGSGSRVWASAVALARYLALRPEAVAGRRVCELGAGVGLVARVCCDLGADVLATEAESRLLEALRANAPRATARRLDWSEPVADELRGAFDVVLGADLVYSSGAVASGLCDAAAALLVARGRLLLCVPRGRHGVDALETALRSARWRDAGTMMLDLSLTAELGDGHAFLLVFATRSGVG